MKRTPAPKPVDRTLCTVCGQRIHVMAHRGSGYCSQTCAKKEKK